MEQYISAKFFKTFLVKNQNKNILARHNVSSENLQNLSYNGRQIKDQRFALIKNIQGML